MIRSRATTSEKSSEQYNHLMRVMKEYPRASVKIGFFEGAGRYPGTNAPTVAEVALWNEFGTKTVPRRPFVSAAIDKNSSRIESWRWEMIENIVAKKMTVEQALAGIGLRIKGLIEKEIRSNVPPPNAASTVRAKQREGVLPKHVHARTGEKLPPKAAVARLQLLRKTKTLIDTGLMLRSVTYKVELGK